MWLPVIYRQLKNQQGTIPLLPILGLLFLTIGIAVVITVLKQPSGDIRSKAAGNDSTIVQDTPKPCTSKIRKLLHPLGIPCEGAALNIGGKDNSQPTIPAQTSIPTTRPEPSGPQKKFSDLLQ